MNELISIQYVDGTASMPDFPAVTHIQGDFDLRSPDGLLGTDAMVTSLNLADFTINREFGFSGLKPVGDGSFLVDVSVLGELTSLTQVPEPSSILLAIVCLVAPLTWRRGQ